MSPRHFTSSRPCAAIAAAVCVAAPLSAGAVELGPPPGAVLSREKLSSIDDFINGEVASGNIPGAIVLIQRHGQPVYFKWFGKRDVEKATPMTVDAIFPIHSVTKTITSVAAMMLVDQGKIALDDPVSKYIPSFAGMKVGIERKDESGRPVLDQVALRRPVNIEDLLLHTSGITYGFYGEGHFAEIKVGRQPERIGDRVESDCWHSLLREGRWPGQQQHSDQPVLHDVLPENARLLFIWNGC